MLCCHNFSRDHNSHKDVKKVPLEKKPPHGVSNRALSNVVTTLNKQVDLSSETQDDSEEQTEDSERYVKFFIFKLQSKLLNPLQFCYCLTQ